MRSLKFMRWLFPQGFQRQYGDQWESLTEEMLAQARAKGPRHLARAVAGLVLDTFCRAPLAHGRELRDRIVGHPPVLVGMGPGLQAITLTRHWVGRPIKSGLRVLAQYGALFIAGAIVAFITHALLEYHATVAVTQLLEPEMSGSIVQPGDYQIALMGLCFLAFIAVASQKWRRWVLAWKAVGYPIAMPGLVFFIGLMAGLHIILLAQIPRVAKDNLVPFVAFPHHMNVPIALPRGESFEKWTQEQKQWLVPGANNYTEYSIRPDRLEVWCAARMAALNTQKINLMAGGDTTTQLAALLWNGQMARAAGEGCLSMDALLAEQNEMAVFANTHLGIFQRTREPLSIIPLFDRLTLAHYLVAPQLFASVERSCPLIAFQEAHGKNYHAGKVSEFCGTLAERFRAKRTLREPDASVWQRIKWQVGLDLTGMVRRQAATTPKMTAADLVWIRAMLRANSDQWLTAQASNGQ